MNKEFQQALINWQKNGMEDFVLSLAEDYLAPEKFSRSLAEIAYNLGFDDLFTPEIDNARSTDGYYNLRQMFASPQSQEKLDLINRFSVDFKAQTLKPKDPKEKDFACKSFIKMCGYINQGIINENNYNAGSALLCKFYNNILKNIPNLPHQNSNDVHLFVERALGTSFSSWKGTYTLNGRDNLKRLQILNTALPKLHDYQKMSFLMNGIGNYLSNSQTISDDFVKGMEENMIPLLKKNGEVTEEDNLWGLYNFDRGIGDFKYETLTTRPTPDNLARLMQYYKEMPTTDWKIFNQNRLDGLAIQNLNKIYSQNKGLENLRDTIHSQRPQTADLISAMVKYYDATKKNKNIEETKSFMFNLNKKNLNYEIEEKYLANTQNYEVQVPHEEEPKIKEKVIDILRRLDKNMHQSMNLPKISDPILRKSAKAASNNKDNLGEFLTLLNDKLETDINNGKVGISPEMIHLLVWTDKKCTETINSMDYEYQRAAYKSEWFKQAVKFSCLTSRGRKHFSSDAFERFYNKNPNISSKTMYKKLSNLQHGFLRRNQKQFIKEGVHHLQKVLPDINSAQAAKMLSKKAFECGDIEVFEKFNREERLSATEKKQMLIIQQYHNRLDSMASGNLSNALQGMLIPHAATTRIGERYRNEELGLGAILPSIKNYGGR